MSKIGEVFVRFCSSLHDWPAALLCMFISIIQMAVLDFYLIDHLGSTHFTWLAADAVVITLLGISIHQARGALRGAERKSAAMGWVAWLSMGISVAAKTVVIFHHFASTLDETDPSFWGPNTLKTTIALSACTFILLLITQHDAPPGTAGRRYIEEITGSVAFDILDTVDILEVLFDADMRPQLWEGLEEFILAVGVLNLLLPTVPLLTLARTRYGHKKPSRKLVHGHRLLLVLVVNVPNLIVRMMLWHGLSAGISPFTLKNIILILLTLYELYEEQKEMYEDHMEEDKTHGVESSRRGGVEERAKSKSPVWTNASDNENANYLRMESTSHISKDNRARQSRAEDDRSHDGRGDTHVTPV